MKKTILILIVSWGLTGCTDFLNIIPKNKKVVASMEDVKLEMYSFLSTFLVTGSSNSMSYGNTTIAYPFRNDIGTFLCMYADEIDMPNFLGSTDTDKYRDVYFENVGWRGTTLSKSIWQETYSCIGLLNTIIKDAGKYKHEDGEAFDRVSGEARVFRAYYLFRLLEFFAPLDNNALGIPINLNQDNISPSGRWTHKETYKLIVDELKEVMAFETNRENWNLFYDPEIIHAILAQVYCFKAMSAAADTDDWANAEKHAAAARVNCQIENSVAQYRELFSTNGLKITLNHSNALFKVSNASNPLSGLSSGPWGNSGTSVAADMELVDLYDENDIRLEAFFNPVNKDGGTIYYAHKYRFNVNRDGMRDVVVLFRASEMMLIQAEALARQTGKLSQAKDLLIEFKKAKMGENATFEGDVLAEILLERRKEFCFECGIRWLDMKRLNVQKTRLGLSDKEDGLVTYKLVSKDYKYALPIPMDVELDYNYMLDQNPGWTNIHE